MPWAKLDDGFFDHPKARAAGKDGRALFVASLCWSGASLSEGVIDRAVLQLLAAKAEVKPAATARRLVDVGLWEAHPDGWLVHDYLDYNPTADKVRETRLKRAEAGRRGGQRPKPPPSKPEANCLANDEANGEAGAKPNRTPYPYPSGLPPQTTSSGRADAWSDERNRNSTPSHEPVSAEVTAGSLIRAAEERRQEHLADAPTELDVDRGLAHVAEMKAARAALTKDPDHAA